MNNLNLMNKLLLGKKSNTILLQSSDEININDKFNPDVNQRYSTIMDKRSDTNFSYSNQMWKPIIGSISKSNINSDDFKMTEEMKEVTSKNIKAKYEIVLEDRLKEKILADKLALDYTNKKDYTNKNNQNNLNNNQKKVLDDITKPIEVKSDELQNIDNSFIELKNSAKNIISKSNDIDSSVIMDSICKLDDLMNSIKNL